MERDISTENRIKKVAYRLFQEKGYAGTRTRDIANEAGVNTALLNYYFRSKEKLFELVMLESIYDIFILLKTILDDEDTSLSTKIELAVEKYIDTISAKPQLPIFVINELRRNPNRLLKKTGIPINVLTNTIFYKQIQDQIDKENLDLSPFHVMLNMVSMSVFPIIGKPLIRHIGAIEAEDFDRDIEDRKRLIPIWIKMTLKID